MMHGRRSASRRSALRVKGGRVQTRNRHIPTGLRGYVIDRESPKPGTQHVVSKRDVQQFIDLISDWKEYSQNLERIVLTADDESDGHHAFYHRERTGGIFLHAWSDDLWVEVFQDYFDEHAHILKRLGVVHEKVNDEEVRCHFSPAQARAFVLLHVFMHELGHHYDSLRYGPGEPRGGEQFAEDFANRHFDLLWPKYIAAFGNPTRER